MKLPGCADAIVDIAKLRDYCLDPHHPRGCQKARVFLSALDLARAMPGLSRLLCLEQRGKRMPCPAKPTITEIATRSISS
jgi:hypothetical protein